MIVHVERYGIQGAVNVDTDDPKEAVQIARELVGGGKAFVFDIEDAPLMGHERRVV